MNNKRNITVGLVLVILGAFLIVQRTIGLDIEIWSFIWPLFILIPGITMHINYFSDRRNPSSLVLAGIMTVYGGLFLFNTLTNGIYSDKLTFLYSLGIGIGFFERYIFGNKRNGDLSASLVFIIISVVIFLKDVLPGFNNLRDYIIPGILIIFGIYILIRKRD